MKKILALLLTAACLALSGCQGLNDWLFENDVPVITPSPGPEITSTPLPGPAKNNLFGVSWSGEHAVQPLANDSRFDAQWLPLVYEGLFQLDAVFQPRELLCSRYRTADNQTFVFTMRTGVAFHDGQPLTARDAEWSLLEAKKPGSPYETRLTGVVAVHALDEITLEVVLSRPNPRLPALLTVPIVPAKSDLLDVAPGTGPYVPVMEEEFSHLSPFDDWWQRGRRPINRLELVPVSSGNQLIYDFESRKLSLVVYNPSDVTGVQFRGDYETWEYDTPILEYIGFNTARAPVDNPLVRQALAAAVDRQAVSRRNADPRWILPAAMPIHPENPLYDPALAAAHGFDLSRVAALFAELGYEDYEGEGTLSRKAGRRTVPLELVMIVRAENTRYAETARRIAAAMTGAGAMVHVEELSQSAYFDALNKGAFDMYYDAVALTADFSPLPFFHDGLLGYGGYKDRETLELWEEAAAETFGTAAKQVFWTRFMEEAPIVPVVFQRQALLMQRGLTVEPRPLWENLFVNLSDWMAE